MCNPHTWRPTISLNNYSVSSSVRPRAPGRSLSRGEKPTGSLDATPRQEPGGQHDLKLGLGNSRLNGAFVPMVGKLSFRTPWSASQPATRRLSPTGRWRAACPFGRSSLPRRSVELSVATGLGSLEAEAGNASRVCPALAGARGGSRPGGVAAERCHRACLSLLTSPFFVAPPFSCAWCCFYLK